MKEYSYRKMVFLTKMKGLPPSYNEPFMRYTIFSSECVLGLIWPKKESSTTFFSNQHLIPKKRQIKGSEKPGAKNFIKIGRFPLSSTGLFY